MVEPERKAAHSQDRRCSTYQPERGTDACDQRARLGAVYTTEVLAIWTASILGSMIQRKSAVVVDPACGDGALLAAMRSHGLSRTLGVDCDPQALALARKRIPTAQLRQRDGLEFLSDAAQGGGTLDAVIANPPWGATLHLDRTELSLLGYRVLSGQVDSWDIFVDGILRAAKPNAPIVLILPDALFLPEHRAIRQILVTESEIAMIARLGEGFFPGVYRGTVVVATRKTTPKANALVACARLPPKVRREILAGRSSLAATVEELAHVVPQARFKTDPECRLDIDVTQTEHSRLATVEDGHFPWDDWLDIGRGIELSKTGRIVRCPRCDTARPVPRRQWATCAACRHRWLSPGTSTESIIRPNDGRRRREWHPLIVGEDVDRHACAVSRQVRTNVNGIRYKPLTLFKQPKLLVRKTGVGLKAVVDHSGAATNQVVFHFSCRPQTDPDVLDYLAGVLCSRVMLAWHLKRQGEVEWRSHPYITPHMIRRFPVPAPKSAADWTQLRAIAHAVRARRAVAGHDSTEDLLVERLVAGMYGLNDRDMAWVLEVLGAAQQLEPIRTLRLPSAALIRPLRLT